MRLSHSKRSTKVTAIQWRTIMASFAAHSLRGDQCRNRRMLVQYKCKGMVEWGVPDDDFSEAADALFPEAGRWAGADDAFSGCEEALLPAPSTCSRILLKALQSVHGRRSNVRAGVRARRTNTPTLMIDGPQRPCKSRLPSSINRERHPHDAKTGENKRRRTTAPPCAYNCCIAVCNILNA